MFSDRISDRFCAAHGVEQHINRMIEARLDMFSYQLLCLYRTEVQHERGRLLMKNPLDYRAVRHLDFEMDRLTDILQGMEMQA